MKTPRIANAIEQIDDELINSALKNKKKNIPTKWLSLAACITVILIALFSLSSFLNEDIVTVKYETTVFATFVNPVDTTSGDYITEPDSETNTNNSTLPTMVTSPTTQPATSLPVTQQATEMQFSEAYFYSVLEGEFSSYVSGKVIEEEKIGSKYCDVYVEGGWKNNANEWLTNETLRAEIYLINGVSKDIAVALKFLDKGDALTTTHYYVITNPKVDLTAVKDYVIAPITPDYYGSETTNESFNGSVSENYVIEYTSQAATQ